MKRTWKQFGIFVVEVVALYVCLDYAYKNGRRIGTAEGKKTVCTKLHCPEIKTFGFVISTNGASK